MTSASLLSVARWYQKRGNDHPNCEKNTLGLGVERPFPEQLSEFWGILGATL